MNIKKGKKGFQCILDSNKHWSQEKTAKLFGVSQTLISQDLQLAEGLKKYPELAKCRNKSEAKKKLKEIQGKIIVDKLAHFKKAIHELTLALDEVKELEIRDKAEALRVYRKIADMALEMQNQCAEIKLHNERRAGELLKEIEKH